VSIATILVIEDDPDIRGLVVALVERAGMRAREAADGRAGVRAFFEERPDLVVLDVGLPELDGWEVLGRIRDLSETPVLMLSAEGEQVQKVRGLEGGADDYVTKPFGREELVARIHALLRRRGSGGAGDEEDETLEDGTVTLDGAGRRVEVDGKEVELTPTEFRLLAFLMRNRNQVVSQLQLLEEVWGNADADPHQVRLYVSYLRRKLNEAGVDPIETVRGFGYRYRIAHPSRPGTA
jgi:DNA-binding response OmpR family regulator